MRHDLIGILSILFLFGAAHASADNTTERINGVSQFLIDRANDNYLYIFERSIKNNNALKCYFGQTRENLELAGLKELLISRELWKSSLENDLDTLLTRSSARYIERTFEFSKQTSTLWSGYIELLQYLEVKHNGNFHPLNQLPIGADQELINLVNSFYETANNINAALEYFGGLNQDNLCQTPVVSRKEFIKKIDSVYKIDESVKKIIGVFKKHLKNKTLKVSESASHELQNGLIAYTESKLLVVTQQNDNVIDDIKELIELTDLFRDDNTSNTVKVVTAFKAIRSHASISADDFNKLKRHVLFFAQVSDSETSDEVSTILKSYTLPSVSFFEKRTKSEKWIINSYLGVAFGGSDVPSGEDDSNSGGIYAPIGLEYSHTIGDGGSLSYMVAPFDFGYPISLKLNGIESEVEFDEIVAPSLGVTYGWPKSPLAIGIMYQKGRTFATSDEQEERAFVHISFDMPLFILM